MIQGKELMNMIKMNILNSVKKEQGKNNTTKEITKKQATHERNQEHKTEKEKKNKMRRTQGNTNTNAPSSIRATVPQGSLNSF